MTAVVLALGAALTTAGLTVGIAFVALGGSRTVDPLVDPIADR